MNSLCHLHTTCLYSKPHGHFFDVLPFGELEIPTVSRDHRNLHCVMCLVDKVPPPSFETQVCCCCLFQRTFKLHFFTSLLSFILSYLAQAEQNGAHAAEATLTDICRSPRRQPSTVHLAATVRRRKANDRCLLQRASTSATACKNRFEK